MKIRSDRVTGIVTMIVILLAVWGCVVWIVKIVGG